MNTKTKAMEKISTLEALKTFFQKNTQSYYFVSATHFNLMPIDSWVKHFLHLNTIDCFDGDHPKITVPTEAKNEVFDSIEDINLYLLSHKTAVDIFESD